jgi:hypothetical protein
MLPEMEKYLSKLDKAIDPAHQEKIRKGMASFLDFNEMEELPFVYRNDSPVQDTDWPSFPYNDAFHDAEKMLLNELGRVYKHVQLRDWAALSIRADLGTVILPSVFGCPWKLTENSMPWADHLASEKEIDALISKGIPDSMNGLGIRCFEISDAYRKILAPYENLSRYVRIFHPDLQGPFDVAHLLWGTGIYFALFDCPEKVHALMRLVTDAYVRFMDAWLENFPDSGRMGVHWNYYMNGKIYIRNDSAILLSPQQYDEFARPYDEELMRRYGGNIHFCGKGDAHISSMSSIEGLCGINHGQPELNDLPFAIGQCAKHHVVIHGIYEDLIPPGVRKGVVSIKGEWRLG